MVKNGEIYGSSMVNDEKTWCGLACHTIRTNYLLVVEAGEALLYELTNKKRTSVVWDTGDGILHAPISEPPTCSRCCWSRYMHIIYIYILCACMIYIYICLDAPIKHVSVHLFYTSDTARVYNSTESKCKHTSKAVASYITTCVRCLKTKHMWEWVKIEDLGDHRF